MLGNCIVFLTNHFSLLSKIFISRILTFWSVYDIVFTLEKLYRKSLRCKYRFAMYHLEERSVPTAIRYKKCAQIFVSNVNKNPIRYTIRDATRSYTV